MTKYIALLRGVNVGGNNKIAMPKLKADFEGQDFSNVVTYINSGNIIFDSDLEETAVKKCCEGLIETSFGLKIIVCIISAGELFGTLKNAPNWWNVDTEAKHNAVFVIPPMTPERIIEEMGETKEEVEQVAYHGKVIFWSAPIVTFSRTRLTRIVKNRVAYEHITIRNANTTLKLASLVQ